MLDKKWLELAMELGVVHEPCVNCSKPTYKRAAEKRKAREKFMALCELEGLSREDFDSFLHDLR